MAIDPNATYTITAAAANKCLQFAGRGMNEQAAAEIAACDKSPAQQFKLQSVPGNYWRFVNAHSGKCLDVQAISSDDGATIQQFSCNPGPNQDWIVADGGPPGTIRLVARHSGKSLDVKDSKTADGTPIVQWTWRSAPNEQFKLTALAPEAPAKGGAPAGKDGGKAKKEKSAKSKT
jgi:endo-1,4-beta-xylanase